MRLDRLATWLGRCALVLLLASCGGSSSSGAAAARERALREAFGEDLGARLSGFWSPVAAAEESAQSAIDDEDFVVFHAAVLQARAAYRAAVDETIDALEKDDAWRRQLFEEVVARGSTSTPSAGTAADGAGQVASMFPEPVAVDSEWMARGAVQNPRLAGEIARATLEIGADLLRLQTYFVGAISEEVARVASEAMQGFQNSGTK